MVSRNSSPTPVSRANLSLSYSSTLSQRIVRRLKKWRQFPDLRVPGERGAVPADAAQGGQVVRGAGARLRQRHQEGYRRRRGEGGQGAAVERRRTEVQQFY